MRTPGGSRRSGFGFVVAIAAATMLLSACTRPPSMMVRQGGDPRHADEDVAFRTTYYFRVFDSCSIQDRRSGQGNVSRPLNDTIYRFKMTGKASTLLSNVRFESGTLKAAQIDPFGSSVERHQETGRFRVISAQEQAEQVRRAQALRQFEQVLNLYHDQRLQGVGLSGVRSRLATALENLIVDYGAAGGSGTGSHRGAWPKVVADSVALKPTGDTGETEDTGDTGDTGETVNTENGGDETYRLSFELQGRPQDTRETSILLRRNDDGDLVVDERAAEASAIELQTRVGAANDYIECRDGQVARRRGFQILGPEGWRTFDQDERLMMVMAADSEPLISTLKELSQRLLRSREAQYAYRVPLAEERLRVAQARNRILTGRSEDDPGALLDRVIAAFEVSGESDGDTASE